MSGGVDGATAAALRDVDVAVIAGGLGTRIRSVLGDVPKILAPIGDRPFLDVLLEWLAGFGARRVVFCLGHGAQLVVERLRTHTPDGVEVITVVEPEPLGTAGALRYARRHLTSNPVLALNGDTFIDADLGRFVANHRGRDAALSLLCVEVDSIARFGSVALDDQRRVSRFVEKDPTRDVPGLISGGMYLFSQTALSDLMALPGPSLERDFLQVLPPGAIQAEVTRGRFVDIGTPESLSAAPTIIGDGRAPSP